MTDARYILHTADCMQQDMMRTSPDFTCDPNAGTIWDQDIRYMLMRPDVLMGIGSELGDQRAFLRALEASTFANARASFEAYLELDLLNGDFLSTITGFAGRLGWGEWRVAESVEGMDHLRVHGSPFASGIGHSDIPACAPISGILRALYLVVKGREARVKEVQCAAQGFHECRFTIDR